MYKHLFPLFPFKTGELPTPDLVVLPALQERVAVVAASLGEAVEVLDHDVPEQLGIVDVEHRLAHHEPAAEGLGLVLLVHQVHVLEHVRSLAEQVERTVREVTSLVRDPQLFPLVELFGDIPIEGSC